MAVEKFIKVAKLGEPVAEVCLNGGATVADAIAAGGFSESDGTIKLNNRAAALTDAVEDGDVILLVPEVKGGVTVILVSER